MSLFTLEDLKLPARARQRLEGLGIDSAYQLARMRPEELLCTEHMLGCISAALMKHGLKLGRESAPRVLPLRGQYCFWEVLVDQEDYDALCEFPWYGHKARSPLRYARTVVEGRSVFLHRMIMKCPDGLETDHRDGNGLNNQKWNLRPVTHQDNIRNSRHLREARTAAQEANLRSVWDRLAGNEA